jgi:hypothetical protein
MVHFERYNSLSTLRWRERGMISKVSIYFVVDCSFFSVLKELQNWSWRKWDSFIASPWVRLCIKLSLGNIT